ncbi:MAG: TlyA family RNA methyltransferase [Candidatus Hydrogenedentes bacterium]|nr:TlyA family RNA methyltransferase [Candidatus Hydrogenedentota bacterium]
MKKERLDILVQRLAGVTRSKAQGLILTRNVVGPDGEVLDKPGVRLPDDTPIEILGEQPYVSRGGQKLEAALDGFKLDVSGVVAIDVGASTGGFTDCLLQRGAARVYAVDVGYGQLAWKLRQDARVVVMERTNIRSLTPGQMPERPNFFTIDCSFISLRLVLPPLKALLAEKAEGVALIKPQFEAGKELVGKGGVVRDADIHERVVADVTEAARELGFEPAGVIPSPLIGPAGNREFLVYLRLRN